MAPDKTQEDAGEPSGTEKWLAYTVEQAQELRRSLFDSTDTVLQSARSYLWGIQSASSQYSHSALSLYDSLKLDYGHYENIFFGRLKEGLQIAGDHSTITGTVIAGGSLLLMKRPRRFLWRNTFGRVQSEESLLKSSENRINELRQSVDLLKKESQKLEERAKLAEEELLRGRTKLKQVGTQIQKLVNSMHRTEMQSQGLMESLRDLPGREALRFRAEVALLTAEAKQKRNSLSKKVSNIANFGIPV